MATKKPATLPRKEKRHATLVAEVESFKTKYKTDFDDPANASSADAALKAEAARIDALAVAYEEDFGEPFDPENPPQEKAWLNGQNVAIAAAVVLGVALLLVVSLGGRQEQQAKVPPQQEQAKAPAPSSPAPVAVAPAPSSPAPVAVAPAPSSPAPVAVAPAPAPQPTPAATPAPAPAPVVASAIPATPPSPPPPVLTEEKIQKMIADGIAAGLKSAPQQTVTAPQVPVQIKESPPLQPHKIGPRRQTSACRAIKLGGSNTLVEITHKKIADPNGPYVDAKGRWRFEKLTGDCFTHERPMADNGQCAQKTAFVEPSGQPAPLQWHPVCYTGTIPG